MPVMFYIEWIFYSIIIAIYVCNMAEIIGNRLSQEGTDKVQKGIEVIQIVLVSSFTLLLLLKSAGK